MDLRIAEVALVTGSSQRIGHAIRCLARERTRVAITYHTEKHRAEKLAERVSTENSDAMVPYFDLASPDSIAAATRHIFVRWLTLDAIPGIGTRGNTSRQRLPGRTDTDRIRSITPETRRRVEENSPVRRVLTPEEVAATVVFLSSAMTSSLTGEIIRIGGRF